MGWFGPSKHQVWRQLSQQIGAEFVKGGLLKGNKSHQEDMSNAGSCL